MVTVVEGADHYVIGVGVIAIGVRKPRQQGIDGRCISVILTPCRCGSGGSRSDEARNWVVGHDYD